MTGTPAGNPPHGDERQERLQQYCDVGPSPVKTPDPCCDRCGTEEGELTAPGDTQHRQTPPELRTGFQDIQLSSDGDLQLCDDCLGLHKYLHYRHAQVTDPPYVAGSVAVFCPCHDEDEVDVQPVYRGDTIEDFCCSRCGSAEVVIEELPPATDPDCEVKL